MNTAQAAAIAACTVPGSSPPEVDPRYRAFLLLPDGTFTGNLAQLTIPPGQADYLHAVIAAGTDLTKPSGGYVIAVDAAGVPTDYIGCFPQVDMLIAMASDPTGPGMPGPTYIDGLLHVNPYGLPTSLAAFSAGTAVPDQNQPLSAVAPIAPGAPGATPSNMGPLAPTLTDPFGTGGITDSGGMYLPANAIPGMVVAGAGAPAPIAGGVTTEDVVIGAAVIAAIVLLSRS